MQLYCGVHFWKNVKSQFLGPFWLFEKIKSSGSGDRPPIYVSRWIPLVESFPTVYGFVYIRWSGEVRDQKACFLRLKQRKQGGLKME